MQRKTTNLGNEQFATIAVNLLHQRVIEADRATAKRMFRELEEGKTLAITRLKLEDGGMVRIDLTLDKAAYNGEFRFSTFRDSVLSLVAHLSDHLRAEKPLVIYHALENQGGAELDDNMRGSRLYGVGGPTVHDDHVNVMMLGVRPNPEQPVVTLLLSYVDPTQFQAQEASSTS